MDGLNVYLYVGNNPINRYDPEGLSWATFRQGLKSEAGGLAKGVAVGGLLVIGVASGGTLAVPCALALGGLSLWGGHQVGKTAYESATQSEYSYSGNGRALTQDEVNERQGKLVVDAAGFGPALKGVRGKPKPSQPQPSPSTAPTADVSPSVGPRQEGTASRPAIDSPERPISRTYDRPEIERPSGKAVKDTDAVEDWDDFLGSDQTDVDPRDGLPDPDRIWSTDGKRSIRYGEHEMNSTPRKQHYHKETWHEDSVENELQRVQQTKKQ